MKFKQAPGRRAPSPESWRAQASVFLACATEREPTTSPPLSKQHRPTEKGKEPLHSNEPPWTQIPQGVRLLPHLWSTYGLMSYLVTEQARLGLGVGCRQLRDALRDESHQQRHCGFCKAPRRHKCRSCLYRLRIVARLKHQRYQALTCRRRHNHPWSSKEAE